MARQNERNSETSAEQQQLGKQRVTMDGEGEPIDARVSSKTMAYSTIICFLAWAFAVYDYTLFGALLPVISESFGWATATGTFIVTIVSIGTFFVAVGVGPLLDGLGRKPALIITTAGAGISSGLTALATGAIFLTIVRIASALGFSEQQVNSAYLNEMYGNHRRRGLMFSFVQGGWPVGIMLGAAFSAVLLPLIGWRGTFLVATLPSVVVIFLAMKLKESPTFLAMKRIRQMEKAGRHDAAKEVGQQFGIDIHHSEQSTFRQLFEPDIRRHTISLGLAVLAIGAAVQVFNILATTVLTEGKAITFTSSLTILIISNAVAFVGYLCLGFIGDLIGRRRLILSAWLTSGIVYTIMLFGPDTGWIVLTLYTVGLFFLIGPFGSLVFFMGESFPTRVRGTGVSAVNAMIPVGLIGGSGLLTAVLNAGGSMVLAAFLSGAIPTLLAAFLMLGTRDVRDPHQAEATNA